MLNFLYYLRKKKTCKHCKNTYRKPWHLFLGEEFCSGKCFDEYIPTMEEENKKRMSIGYPHMLEIVKEKCPKCSGKMVHDQFQKLIDFKDRHLKACYNCTECEYRVLFDLTTNKFEKKPFGLKNDAKKQEEETQ